jgi:hypothetical protein
MKRKWKRMTAAEGMAILRSDPEWVRQNAEREARHEATVEQLQREIAPENAPLLAELAAAGYSVSSVWDLVNTSASYPNAIPVLTRHLRLAHHPVMRQGIARALTVKEARGTDAPRAVLEELKSGADESGSEARWALANALTVVADTSMIDEIRALARDARYQDVKERLETALKNLGNPG